MSNIEQVNQKPIETVSRSTEEVIKSIGDTAVNVVYGDEINVRSNEIYEREDVNPENIRVTGPIRADGRDVDEPGSWNGSISLVERVKTQNVDIDNVETAFSPENLKGYFVRAYRSARIRCVDGRRIEGYDERRATMRTRELGPQGAGGTPGAAVCFMLAEGPKADTYSETTFIDDVKDFSDELHSLGFELGGHTDDKASGEKTGCGAIDRMPEILKAISDENNTNRIIELTKAVMGSAYDADSLTMVLGNAIKMNASARTYFSGYRPSVFEKLKEHTKKAVSNLVGAHNEVGAIVNRMYGYTFHRDEFSYRHNHELQAFNYDYWKSVEMTHAMVYKGNHFDTISEEEKAQLAKRILTARVMYTVATLMTLTDGSINLYVVDELHQSGQQIDPASRIE